MKVQFDIYLPFSSKIKKALSPVLKKHFLNIFKLETPILALMWNYPHEEKKNFNFRAGFLEPISYALTNGGYGLHVKRLEWASESRPNFDPCIDDEVPDDVTFKIIGICEEEEYVQRVREGIIARTPKKELWPGYMFIVEVKDLALDIKMQVYAIKSLHEQIYTIIDEAAFQYGENSEGLVHNIRKEKTTQDSITFKLDLGSAGEDGLKYILKALSDSNLEIEKILIKT